MSSTWPVLFSDTLCGCRLCARVQRAEYLESRMIDAAFSAQLRTQVENLETRLSEPATVSDRNLFRDLITKHAALKKRLEKAEHLRKLEQDLAENRSILADEESDADLRTLAESEQAELEDQVQQAEREFRIAMLPPDPAEARSAIAEIRAGTGGDEAGLFAGDLYRMYAKFAETRGWKTGIIDASTSTQGGFKQVVFSIEGEHAYGTLQFESGVHRVQRVPATEASGRIHTSAATVAVFPEADETDHIDIDPEELRIDIFCSSGPGGQSVNTTYSAVRVTHLPTGLVAQSQDERSQHRNKEKAMTVLRARLLDHMRREENERMGSKRRELIGSGDRSEKIRTYNFPQNRVSDHRIGLTLYTLDRIMEGELASLLDALYERDLESRIQKELAEPGGAEPASGPAGRGA